MPPFFVEYYSSSIGHYSINFRFRRLSNLAVAKIPNAKLDDKAERLNVGTIGHIDHGKTTLTAAITKVLAEQGVFTKINPIGA